MQVAIIKYNAGNIRSVLFAMERIGVKAIVTDVQEELERADKLIFPGVGEARSAMKYLKDKGIDGLIRNAKQPLLGICLGMQLLCRHSEENDTDCLGIFDTPVKRFPSSTLKVPQVGWNSVVDTSGPLFNDIPPASYFYFVHSYYAAHSPQTIATTEYGIPFSSALARDNFYGVQFHPEKSAAAGEQLLKNFLAL